MTDIRRTLLWVVFSMSLVLLWDGWNKYNGQPSFFDSRPPMKTAPPDPAGVSAISGAVGSASSVNETGVGGPVSERTSIQTDLVNATFDTKGGDLIRVELRLYQEQIVKPWYAPLLELFSGGEKAKSSVIEPKNVVVLDDSGERRYVAQSGLVPPSGVSQWPTHNTAMTLVPGERTLKQSMNQLEVRFESPEVGGVKLVKTYVFRRGEYVVAVKHEVVNQSNAVVSPRLYLQLVRDGKPLPGESSLYSTFTGPVVYTDSANKFQKIEFEDIEKGEATHDKEADNGWIAMVQHYFVSAWLIGADKDVRFPRQFETLKVGNDYWVRVLAPLGEIAPGTTKLFDTRLFVGPQEEHILRDTETGLDLVRDYGRLTILAKPLFWLLKQLHTLCGNWGWAIVGLVVLLKIAFYWLNATAYRSMAKMKAINPKVMEARERLKDKPQQMQQEMMRIYREEKVNPLGGCLPILVQMPFFIALYSVLLSSVEMRGAPWVGWITDLSVEDPYFVLPLLMTLSSLVQTWLNPTPPDPVQARMMWIMPLMFSFMFFVFPAGLVLYWLTNNILSIAQQWLINKRLGVLGK